MRTGRCASSLAFFSLMLVAAPFATAHAADHWRGLVGNWKLEFRDKDGRPAGTGEFAFHSGPAQGDEGKAGGIVMEPSQAPNYREYTCTGRFEGAILKLECGTYGFTNHMSYVTLQLSADADTLRGTWGTSADRRDGVTVWTRTIPAIQSVEVLGQRWGLDYTKVRQEWANGGAPPYIRLRMRGKDLPLWINTYASPKIDISIDDPRYRIARESLSVDDLSRRWRRGILEVPVELLPGAQPGRKVITLNGSRKAFDVIFDNYGDVPDAPKVTTDVAEGAAKEAPP